MAPEFSLSPQASTYRPAPTGWRETRDGSVYYRVFADGGFEVMGKIRDPQALGEVFSALAGLLSTERDLMRQKRPGRRRRGGDQNAEGDRGLFGQGEKSLAVHLEKIRVF